MEFRLQAELFRKHGVSRMEFRLQAELFANMEFHLKAASNDLSKKFRLKAELHA